MAGLKERIQSLLPDGATCDTSDSMGMVLLHVEKGGRFVDVRIDEAEAMMSDEQIRARILAPAIRALN